jgi:putative integral membrane protein (TIGR02587 family)
MQEARDFTRAFAGAYIFSIPLLFTMEMWWIGEYAEGTRLIVFLLIALVANLGLNYVAGFKSDGTFFGAFEQAIDALAVGIVAAAALLLILDRIQPSDPLASIVGMVAIQAVPLSIGASVANQVFGRYGERSRGGDDQDNALPAWKELLNDVGATAIGSVFIAFSIAPTDEVQMLAAGMNYAHLVFLAGFSLLLSYAIVFASEFDRSRPSGPFQHPISETTLAYIVSLAVAALALYLFHQIDASSSPYSIVKQVVVLGLPATVGGAAGRLVV